MGGIRLNYKRIIFILAIVLIYLLSDLIYRRMQSPALAEEVFQQASKNPYFVHVDLDNNTMYIFKDGKVIKTYPVSGGKPSTPSPLGTWTIISKDTWGEGFGGTWMGFNVPWGKYGIHGTDEPWSIGHDLSKGCIRLYNKDAEAVRKLIPVGTKINIVKGPYGPFGDRFRVLKPGAIGSDVMAVQKRLQEMGYFNGWPDGKYGDGMKAALHRFQKANKLPVGDTVTMRAYEVMGFIPFE